MTELLIYAVPALPVLACLVLPFAAGPRADRVNAGFSVLTALAAYGLAWSVLSNPSAPARGSWYLVDAAGASFLVVIATIGLLSALTAPRHLTNVRGSFFGPRAPRRAYHIAFQLFWGTLLVVPIVDNLAAAWILIEATTAASALLVSSGGARRALEAGWKYLVLTTLGLTVALLGLLVLYAALPHQGASLGVLDFASIQDHAGSLDHELALVALVLLLGGFATKIGWAPVHNWLPDAHSEAPPPVSALLSAALLPTVMLIAWRCVAALEPAVDGAGSGMFIAFGLGSLVIAVPFLWQRLPLKRLLAYSSLEHMGVLALGIGFGTPLALAGVLIHLAGHALAKSLGFYAAIPLMREDPRLSTEAPSGLAATNPAGAVAVGVSLACLSGLPPSPLFFSEVMILLGGIGAGLTWVVVVAAVLLALGFLGLAHALIESVVGDTDGPGPRGHRPERQLGILTTTTVIGLLALVPAVFLLPDSGLVDNLIRSVS